MLITVSPPVWANGELLSAAKLNQVTTDVNAIRGACLAPTGIFCQAWGQSDLVHA
jgi:hypothetical protein